MDRRSVLKGFGSIVGWSLGPRSRLLSPVSLADVPIATRSVGGDEYSETASAGSGPGDSDAADIRKLSQHFKQSNNDISPWTFLPQENIKSFSTATHPGYATIRDAGLGKDIKG